MKITRFVLGEKQMHPEVSWHLLRWTEMDRENRKVKNDEVILFQQRSIDSIKFSSFESLTNREVMVAFNYPISGPI